MKHKKVWRAAAVWMAAAALSAPSFISMAAETSVVSRMLSVLKVEGENALVNRCGARELEAFDGMSLSQGDCVTTGMGTEVYIQADEDKTVKMDQNSIVEVSKVSSRKLKLTLMSGELFFDVENHLQEDETMEFDAAGTTLSIRGTAGLLGCHGDQVSLYLLEGTVVWTVNGKPVTVRAGQKMTAAASGEKGVPGLADGQVSEFTADELGAFELGTVLENRERLDIPAGVGVEAEGDFDRLSGILSGRRRTEKEIMEKAAGGQAAVLAALPQSEPGSGMYEIAHDEGGDDVSYPLADTPPPDMPGESDKPEEPLPQRPIIDFKCKLMGIRENNLVVVNNATNIPAGQNAHVRVVLTESQSGITFDSANEIINLASGNPLTASIDGGLNEQIDMNPALQELGLLHNSAIRVYVTVYTDEEAQFQYAGCRLEESVYATGSGVIVGMDDLGNDLE